ncbi:MAG: CBS domain-containing protein [Gemmatimonadaceae bacterium]
MSFIVMACAVFVVAVLTVGATAVRAVSRLWLRHWVERQSSGLGTMAKHLERPTRLVHAAGTGATLVVFATGALLTGIDAGSPWILTRDAIAFAILLIGIGQLLPRAIGRRWAAQLVPVFVPVLLALDTLVSPFLRLGRFTAGLIVKPTMRAPNVEAREGLEDLLRDGALQGIGAGEEMAIISGVVQFGDKTARDTMTPRTEVFSLDEALPPMEIARRLAHAAYSRVPIYRDTPDNIIGMIHAFDVLRLAGERMPPLRPVAFATETKPASELLFEMLRARRHLAVVRNAQNLLTGIVTLEDLLEELVGDIRDEHDEPAPKVPGATP